MAAQYCVGDRVASALDSYYEQYARFCVQLGYRPADYDVWLKLEHPGGARMLRLHQTRKEHEARKAQYRAKLASEAAAALQPYAE